MLAQLKFFKRFSEGARSSDFPGVAARVRSRRRGGFNVATGLLSALPIIAALLWISLPAHAAECVGTVSQVGAETVVIFTTTDNSSTYTCTWTVPLGVTQVGQLLVVGGGGGGGFDVGGGGGAGGYLGVANVPVLAGTQVAVVVGAGGAGATGYTNLHADNGSNSSFGADYVALGGGGGGSGIWSGSDGGSGGGSAEGRVEHPDPHLCPPMGGSATQPLQPQGGLGNHGGSAVCTPETDWTGGGGGGGGATQTGFDNTGVAPWQGGDGGAGQDNLITGAQQWFAGGGGGGSNATGQGVVASGGSGVGGNGGGFANQVPIPPTAGAPGTGSGGGGGYNGVSGAAGGSGIVIIRYAVSAVALSAAIPTLGEAGLTVFMLMLALAIFLVRRPMA